ncbi:MAG: hypothetical protein FJ102_25080 [Deltaproteobacteria bacterium]|nr:hypothetical protein [Deltaproteobacteria bacterium]
MLQHLVGWAVRGTLLFHTWAEGLVLFRALVRQFPELSALCVMPHHVHVLGEWPDAEERLVLAEAAYARFRNRARGERGAVWARHPQPSRVVDELHGRRTVRYIHLNPVREHLAGCPLEWPLSTHRDACGLVTRPVVAVQRDPEGFHRYVSSDPDASVVGTPFPQLFRQDAVLAAALAAASSTGRYPLAELRRRPEARRHAIGTASLAGLGNASLLAAALDLSRSRAAALLAEAPTHVRALDVPRPLLVAATVLNDPRFASLGDGDLRATPSWRRLRAWA